MTFSEQIAKLRESRSLLQKDLAGRSGRDEMISSVQGYWDEQE